MNYFKTFTNGLLKENPTFVLMLGMCPTLGTTSSAINGLGMGLATTFVLLCSNVVISALKKLIPDKQELPNLQWHVCALVWHYMVVLLLLVLHSLFSLTI